MRKNILLIFADSILFSCTAGNKKVTIEDESGLSCGCSGKEPPPPPPKPFMQLAEQKMDLKYFGEKITFKVKLYSDRLVYLDGRELQTYFIEAENHEHTDSFYFALPQGLEHYWRDLKIEKENARFNIGYSDTGGFHSLYTVYLGDTLNMGHIYMNTPEYISYMDSIHHNVLDTEMK